MLSSPNHTPTIQVSGKPASAISLANAKTLHDISGAIRSLSRRHERPGSLGFADSKSTCCFYALRFEYLRQRVRHRLCFRRVRHRLCFRRKACMHTYVHADTHACTDIDGKTNAETHIYIYINTHAHTYIHAHMHTCIRKQLLYTNTYAHL